MTAAAPTSVVPKLRFREFRSAGVWRFEPLGHIAEPISDRAGVTRCVPMSVTTGVGLVSQEAKFGRIIAGDSYKNYIPLQTNDFAYNKSATKEFPQGYIARYCGTENAAVPNSIFTCFRPNTAAVIPEYLDYLFHGNHHGRWLRRFITVGARAHGALSVSGDDLMLMPVPLPPITVSRPEQQKIADFLGSLDELIAAESRRVEVLRQHKQGLMQQLFPQPGETQPMLRFPEFADAREWEARELGPMTSKVGSGITPLGGDKNYWSSGRPFIRSQNIGWGELILDDVAYIDEDTHGSFPATELEEDDVLLNITGASIGRSAVADARIACGNVNQHVCIIRVISDQIQPWFLSQYLISSHGQDQIDSCQAGGNRQGLNFGQIRLFVIPQPTLIAEQERIADCLRAADAVLASQVRRIGALKSHKQGLLQQLFPAPEAK
jgi:type I restriction enzyme S subunit